MIRNHVAAGCLMLAILLVAQPAAAYIGPGAGITMLGALWGVLVAVLLALAAVLFWPIRALLRRRRRKVAAATERTAEAASGEESSA